MTRVLVLGARGFLGRPIAAHLGVVGHEVHLHARQPPGLTEPPVPSGALSVLDLETAPLADIRDLFESLHPDVVVNCVGATMAPARDLRSANVVVVERLIRVLARVGGTRLVHLGSAAEYGITERDLPVRECHTVAPVSDYGLSKLAATLLVQDHARTDGVAAVVLRIFNPIGRDAPVTSVAGRTAVELRRALICDEPFIRLGHLDTWRDYVGTQDVARAVEAAVSSPGRPGLAEIYNVGRGVAVSTRQMIADLADIAGYQGEIIEGAPSSGRSAGVEWQQADITAISERFGWQPTQTMRDMLTDLWDERPTPPFTARQ